ncbi:Uncharacterised protein [Salmonella enterica subsp. enterica serovar Poona]|nr:Uncharacterised protein [Salmonella enterica subsp. enterica serovar Poona]
MVSVNKLNDVLKGGSCGESVPVYTVAEQIAVKPVPGTGFKIPCPPDQLIIAVAYDQPEMCPLIILYSNIGILRCNRLCLLARKWPIR